MKTFYAACLILLCAAFTPRAHAQTQNADATKPWSIGSWGEIHYNSGDGAAPDQLDIHRVAFTLGYELSEDFRFYIEPVLEHALVEDGDGRLLLQQLFVDARLLGDFLNLRLGRALQPIGIVNQDNRPTQFFSVEQPMLEERLFGSIWFADGVGLWGKLTPHLAYQVRLTASLAGNDASAVGGLQPAVQRQTPGLSEPGFIARADFVAVDLPSSRLQLGGSFFYGGLDNGEAGVNPGNQADLTLIEADLRARAGRWEARGLMAWGSIGGAATLPGGIGDELFGWYTELAWHWLPALLRFGVLQRADAVLFGRFESADTQEGLPVGGVRDLRASRHDWVVGMALMPLPQLTLKCDYQWRDDASAVSLPNQLNIGLGWAI